MNTTTKRFSRSLAEAFPDERAVAIEVTRRSPWREVPSYAGFLGFLALVLFGFPMLAHFVARFA